MIMLCIIWILYFNLNSMFYNFTDTDLFFSVIYDNSFTLHKEKYTEDLSNSESEVYLSMMEKVHEVVSKTFTNCNKFT